MSDPLIIYACPVGELATQLNGYFAQSEQLCGRNAAHNYMPHCTLTGFFRDEEQAIQWYVEAIAKALTDQYAIAPYPDIKIIDMTFRPDWHGLELQSDWLHQLMFQVAQSAISPTRSEPLRLKSWLHLSLAYEFLPEHAQTLKQLAQTSINPDAAVEWELRFYQRHPNYRWTCHQSWQLTENMILLNS
jgi:ubiquitin-associated SH3 domain-containing protein